MFKQPWRIASLALVALILSSAFQNCSDGFSSGGPSINTATKSVAISNFPLGSAGGGMNYPSQIALDSANNIYVTDSNNHRVQVFDKQGYLRFSFGSQGSGPGQFSTPMGIAIGPDEQIYVADFANHRIQIFDSQGGYLAQFGTYGTASGQFNWPYGVAVDSNRNIYVTDTQNNRVQIFNSSLFYSRTIGGLGKANGQMQYPTGIALDGQGNLYVMDYGNARLQIFDASSGVFKSAFGGPGPTGGQGNGPAGDGQFSWPLGVAVDSLGQIYIADRDNDRVQIWSSSGTYLKSIGSHGTELGQFQHPRGVAVDFQLNLFVVDGDNNRVQKFNSSGQPVNN